MGIKLQPIHIYVSPMFLSDLAEFAKELDFRNTNENVVGSISSVKPSKKVILPYEIHFGWFEIYQVEVFLSVYSDSHRVNFYNQGISLFSKIPNLSERKFALPAIFASDVICPLKKFFEELGGDYRSCTVPSNFDGVEIFNNLQRSYPNFHKELYAKSLASSRSPVKPPETTATFRTSARVLPSAVAVALVKLTAS